MEDAELGCPLRLHVEDLVLRVHFLPVTSPQVPAVGDRSLVPNRGAVSDADKCWRKQHDLTRFFSQRLIEAARSRWDSCERSSPRACRRNGPVQRYLSLGRIFRSDTMGAGTLHYLMTY